MTRRDGVGCWVLGVGCRLLPGRTEHLTPYTLHPTSHALCLALALLNLLASPAVAADAVALLRRGEQAERSTRYSGVKLIWACGSEEAEKRPDYQRSSRIWHDGPGRTRLEILDAAGALTHIVVENGSQRWFYSPRRHSWRPVAWRPPQTRLDLLLRNYRILRGPVETVAGRRALQVRIEPRLPYGPRKETWLDLATGISLRSDLYARSGRLVSRSEFLEFRPERTLASSLFTVPVTSAWRGRVHGGAHSWTEQTAVLSPSPPLAFASPHYLPRGFALDRVTRLRSDGSDVVRALFTDGLNTLLLVEWQGPREPEEGRRARFWGPGERHQWTLGPMHALLAGDLPASELERIAGSVRPSQGRPGSLVTRK
jgi:negative regulator of sigma E activity